MNNLLTFVLRGKASAYSSHPWVAIHNLQTTNVVTNQTDTTIQKPHQQQPFATLFNSNTSGYFINTDSKISQIKIFTKFKLSYWISILRLPIIDLITIVNL